MEVLSLVDVSSETASRTWPLLLEAIRSAHFTALDLELSGLGDVIGRGKGQTIESRYSEACGTVNTRAILSLGLACFQWNKPPSHCPERDLPTPSRPMSPTTEPSAGEGATLTTDLGVGVGVRVFNVWLMCQSPYTIDPSSARFLLQHGFDFNKQIARGIPYTPGPLEVEKGDNEKVSLHHLLATILAVGKPLVVHNGWIDLLFLYGDLYSPLPPSLGTLMADMSEMFVGGVYDTKAIAQYEVPQEATFLEYLFRKCQRDNEVLMTRGSSHLWLYQDSLPSSIPTESVTLTLPRSLSLEEVAAVTVCETFSRAGFCHKASCPHSHNVLTVLAQHEQRFKLRQMKRKRKREQKLASLTVGQEMKEASPPPHKQHCSTSSPAGNTEDDDGQRSLAEKFASELASARQRLATSSEEPPTSEIPRTSAASDEPSPCCSVGATTEPVSTSSTHTSLSDVEMSEKVSNVTEQRPSYGHRAGFDAFMTGYVFAHFALTQTNLKEQATPTGSLPFDEVMIAALSSMRNRLSNRNKPVPLILARSQFDKTSPGHTENHLKIEKLKKSLFEDP